MRDLPANLQGSEKARGGTALRGPTLDMADDHALPVKRLTLPNGTGVALWLAGPAGPGGVSETLWHCLSQSEMDRANRFLRPQDRCLFALTRAVLRSVLSQAANVPADQIRFTEGPYGKPRLAGISGPHFNVSHSGSWALIGVSESRPIGVDIEVMREAGDELGLARSFFSNAEYRALKRLENSERLHAFYKIWTCKEAVLKALGTGITEHQKEFSVELTREGYLLHAESDGFIPVLASLIARPVEVESGYAACYALA